MKTIERNYRKNPHKASLLLAFHTAGAHNIDGQVVREVAPRDLLAEIPVEAPAYRPNNAQESYIHNLIVAVTALDAEAGRLASNYTREMTDNEAWTPENTSRWIDRLIAKRDALKTTAKPVAPVQDISPGRYGITKDDEVKCYSISYGKAGTRWDGFLFLARISSDDEFPIRNRAEKALILAAIGEDVEAARILAALTLKKCSRCGRQLSDTKNPYYPIGLGPDCGGM